MKGQGENNGTLDWLVEAANYEPPKIAQQNTKAYYINLTARESSRY
jgi:hypothetical protein